MKLALGVIGFVVAGALAASWRPPVVAPVLAEDELPRALPAFVDEAPRTIDELRQKIAAVLEREGVPGVAIALVNRNGPIWIGGVGVADRESKRPIDGTTVFRVASITKSFIGLAVMKLVDQGRVELDRPLHDLMPEVAIDNAWERDSPVTLAHVLEHTAGLDDMRPNETFTDDDAMPASEALALNPRSRVIRWRPGTRPSYSNVGYGLAGRAIELVTHEPFDVWVRREVLLPLGMRDADFRRTELLSSRLAVGYDGDRARRFTPIAHRAAGSLLASATDLAKLVRFWLVRGEGYAIVSRAGLDRIERQGTLPFPHMDTEYGLGNYGDVGHPVRSRGHDGGLPGFVSLLRYFPELDLGYVLLFNATHSFRAIVEVRQLVFAYLARDRVLPRQPIARGAPPAAEAYGFTNPRHQLVGFFERALLGWRTTPTPAGVFVESTLGHSVELVRTQDGGYKLPGESGTSVRFLHDRDGTPIMVAQFAFGEGTSWWFVQLRYLALVIAILLLVLAPVYATLGYVINKILPGPVRARGLVVWPAIAGLCLHALPRLFLQAANDEALGDVCFATVGVCVTTIVFAIAGAASLYSLVRWSRRPDRPPLWRRIIPSAMALAAAGMALWFAVNGIVGLRTWAW